MDLVLALARHPTCCSRASESRQGHGLRPALEVQSTKVLTRQPLGTQPLTTTGLHPLVDAQQVARHFLAEIGDEPWRYPSVPIAELSNQPEYEVRQAALPVEGQDWPVRIWYRHIYATDVVEVLAVTNRWSGYSESAR